MQLIERYLYKIHESQGDLSVPPEPYPEENRRYLPAMKAYLYGRRLSYSTAKDNCWYPTDSIKEKNPTPRIVIPCFNSVGRPYWQGRAMIKHELRYRSAQGKRFQSIVVMWPRILEIAKKEHHSEGKPLVLVEGPMDALAAAAMGHAASSFRISIRASIS